MNKQILKDLADMVHTEIISEETAIKIKEYYKAKQPEGQQQLFVIFGILGSILVGLGLILIVAHNWEQMGRSLKTIWAMLPMLVGQGLCLYVLLKRNDSMAWREGSSAFLFFAVGACIALVGQIYNVPGSLPSFLNTWMLLVFPLMYIMRASIGSILYIIGISYYGLNVHYEFQGMLTQNVHFGYWGLLLLALPYYYLLYKKSPTGSFMIFHHWVLAVSVALMLGFLNSTGPWSLGFLLYATLFGFYYNFGHTPFAKGPNGYLVLGALGSLVLFFIGSFYSFWENIQETSAHFFSGFGLVAILILAIAAIGILVWRYTRDPNLAFDPSNFAFIVYFILFLMGMASPILGSVLCNVIVAAIGVLAVREGTKQDHLGMLNYGLLVISVLVVCRYFDLNISFVIRGFLFILIGAGFFVANYLMFKKRKEMNQQE